MQLLFDKRPYQIYGQHLDFQRQFFYLTQDQKKMTSKPFIIFSCRPAMHLFRSSDPHPGLFQRQNLNQAAKSKLTEKRQNLILPRHLTENAVILFILQALS
jgi:hypothetical protein